MADISASQKQLDSFKNELNNVNDLIVDMGSELGDNLVKSLTKTITELKKIKDPLKEAESIAKKITDLTDENALLTNQLAISERNYTKALQSGNAQEIKKAAAKNNQLRAHIQINNELLLELASLKETADIEAEITKHKQKQNVFLDLIKNKTKEIWGNISGMLTIAGVFKLILEGITRANEASVNISKNLGYGAARADAMVISMQGMADASGATNMTLKNMVEASNQLAETTGYVMDYSNMNADKARDILETQVMLTKQMGLTGAEAAHIYEMSVLTGKSSGQVNDEMLQAFTNARNATKAGVSMKQAFAEASKISGRLQANFRGNAAAIVDAVVKAKALGTTLEQTAKQGDTLLDFTTSIESELKAELLTGKQLNLERARAAALAGDQVALAEELNKNIGSYEDFSKMNVLQQKALAEAVGLTADELAEQLKKQQIAKEQGKSLAEVAKDEAEAAQKRKTIQEKFNNIVEKLQDIIGSIGTLLSPVIEMFTWLADHAWVVYTILGVKLLSSLPFLIGGFKNMVGSIKGMATGALDTVKALTQKGGLKSLLSGANAPAATPTPTAPTAPGGKGGGLGSMFKGISTTDMIKGAAAILILSAALFVAAKAFQEFATVKWEDVAKGAVGIGALAGIAMLLGQVQGEMIKGAIAVAILGVALIPFAYAMSLIAGLDISAVLAAAAGLVIFGAAVFGLGALMMTGVGAFIFGAGILAIIALGGAMIILGAGLQVVANAGTGITALFKSLTELDVNKLNAIAPALAAIGAGIMALGAGSIMAGIGGLLGGGPVDIIKGIAESGDGLQKAATGLQGVATALTQVSAALASIDASKLEALEGFATKMTVGSVVKGITDFITSPIKAVGSMVEGSEGGGKEEAMIKAINEVRDAVNKLYSKDSSIKMDGKEVGTTLTQGSYQLA